MFARRALNEKRAVPTVSITRGGYVIRTRFRVAADAMAADAMASY